VSFSAAAGVCRSAFGAMLQRAVGIIIVYVHYRGCVLPRALLCAASAALCNTRRPFERHRCGQRSLGSKRSSRDARCDKPRKASLCNCRVRQRRPCAVVTALVHTSTFQRLLAIVDRGTMQVRRPGQTRRIHGAQPARPDPCYYTPGIAHCAFLWRAGRRGQRKVIRT
jgi:hypothetical protein